MNIDCLLLLKEWPRLICFPFWPTSFPRSGLTDADAAASAILTAVSSCQQLSLTGGLWVLSDLLRTHPEEERKLLETSYDQFIGSYTVLSIGAWNETCHWNSIFEDLLNLGNIIPAAEQRTPDEMAPFEGAEGGTWLSQRVARWLKLQVNQLRHMTGWGKPENTWAKKCTENSSNSQRRTFVDPQVSWGFYIVDFCVTSGLIFENWHITYTCENVYRLPHPWHPRNLQCFTLSWLVNISFENRWQNRCGTWISDGFPHGWKWDPSRGSTATWR